MRPAYRLEDLGGSLGALGYDDVLVDDGFFVGSDELLDKPRSSSVPRSDQVMRKSAQSWVAAATVDAVELDSPNSYRQVRCGRLSERIVHFAGDVVALKAADDVGLRLSLNLWVVC